MGFITAKKGRILVSNANVVFSNFTEIITSTLSAQKENNFKELCLERLDRCQPQKVQPP